MPQIADETSGLEPWAARFAADAFESVRATDLEANSVGPHVEAGLCGAAWHWRLKIEAGLCTGPDNWRTMEEDTWTWRLGQHLTQTGYVLPARRPRAAEVRHQAGRLDHPRER